MRQHTCPEMPARLVEILAAPLLKKDGGAMETWACFLPVMTSARPKMAFSMDTKKSAMAWSARCNRQRGHVKVFNAGHTHVLSLVQCSSIPA